MITLQVKMVTALNFSIQWVTAYMVINIKAVHFIMCTQIFLNQMAVMIGLT